MNSIQSWMQGYFVDKIQYENWTEDQKEEVDKREKHLVRPAPTENAICHCPNPNDAKWIAQRLNLASKLEQMTYDFATGKTDGEDIVNFVQRCVYL